MKNKLFTILLVALMLIGTVPVMADDVVQPIEQVIYYDQSGYDDFIESLSNISAVEAMFPELKGKLLCKDQAPSGASRINNSDVSGVYIYEDGYGNVVNLDVNTDGTYTAYGVYMGVPMKNPPSKNYEAHMGSISSSNGYTRGVGARAFWCPCLSSLLSFMEFYFDYLIWESSGYTELIDVYDEYSYDGVFGSSGFQGEGTLTATSRMAKYQRNIVVLSGEVIDTGTWPTEPMPSATSGYIYLRIDAKSSGTSGGVTVSIGGAPTS